MISKVAASEMEGAQTGVRAHRGSDCINDLLDVTERFWEDRPERVKAPYVKRKAAWQNPEYYETRETL